MNNAANKNKRLNMVIKSDIKRKAAARSYIASVKAKLEAK